MACASVEWSGMKRWPTVHGEEVARGSRTARNIMGRRACEREGERTRRLNEASAAQIECAVPEYGCAIRSDDNAMCLLMRLIPAAFFTNLRAFFLPPRRQNLLYIPTSN